MPPPLSWADLRGANVAVWGLGVEGRASVARLRATGVVPQLVDDSPPAPTLDDLPVVATSDGGLEILRACEVVVKSPGISRYRDDVVDLVARGVAVVGGVGLWLEDVDRSRVVGITGTKGKSTTTSIVGHLLRGFGHECFVGGNLGGPPFALEAGDDHEYWVVELSSYQVTDLASAPGVVVVTSLHPDHLNWHGGDLEHYYADKLAVCTLPGRHVTVADASSAELRARVDLLGPDVRWVEAPSDSTTDWSAVLGLRGAHNARNAALARQALIELGIAGATDDARVAHAALGFVPLPSRLTVVGTVAGIEFVDDSLSTNVLPTIAAVESFGERPLALVVGGFDRGIAYDELAQMLSVRNHPTLVIGIPDNGADIVDVVRSAVRGPQVECATADSVESATATGFEWLRQRKLTGVVLLSPAAASFGRFGNYRERSAAFVTAMRALPPQSSPPRPAPPRSSPPRSSPPRSGE
jgi:UDP-N-acetylmuramoylalanine--D-glutamate ligase